MSSFLEVVILVEGQTEQKFINEHSQIKSRRSY